MIYSDGNNAVLTKGSSATTNLAIGYPVKKWFGCNVVVEESIETVLGCTDISSGGLTMVIIQNSGITSFRYDFDQNVTDVLIMIRDNITGRWILVEKETSTSIRISYFDQPPGKNLTKAMIDNKVLVSRLNVDKYTTLSIFSCDYNNGYCILFGKYMSFDNGLTWYDNGLSMDRLCTMQKTI